MNLYLEWKIPAGFHCRRKIYLLPSPLGTAFPQDLRTWAQAERPEEAFPSSHRRRGRCHPRFGKWIAVWRRGWKACGWAGQKSSGRALDQTFLSFGCRYQWRDLFPVGCSNSSSPFRSRTLETVGDKNTRVI